MGTRKQTFPIPISCSESIPEPIELLETIPIPDPGSIQNWLRNHDWELTPESRIDSGIRISSWIEIRSFRSKINPRIAMWMNRLQVNFDYLRLLIRCIIGRLFLGRYRNWFRFRNRFWFQIRFWSQFHNRFRFGASPDRFRRKLHVSLITSAGCCSQAVP